MKFLTIILFALCLTGNPKKGSSIVLNANSKVESTFSGTISGNQSFHLIVAKNKEKDNFEIIPVSNNDGELKQLRPIAFDTHPSIISFHNTNETVSLIVSSEEDKTDKFSIVNVNLVSGVSDISETFSGEDFKAVIRKATKNTLIFSNRETLKIVEIEGLSLSKSIDVITTEDDDVFLKDLNISKLDAVNTDEFVANGSIEEFRVYKEGDILFFTRENKRTSDTTVSKISLENGGSPIIEATIFKSQSSEKTKKSTSFFNGKNVFKLQLDRKEGLFSVYDLDGTTATNLDLSNTKISNSSKGFEDVDDFLKKASKYMNEPTITVNKTKSGDLAIRMDYVDKKTYMYQYNWWWWHDFMWSNQFMMRSPIGAPNVPTGFGPSPIDFEYYYFNDEYHYFDIILDLSFENIKLNTIEMVNPFVDKKKYIDKLEENVTVKYSSSVFFENEMRYFCYDKKTNSFKVLIQEFND
jgi:hypothetical protein